MHTFAVVVAADEQRGIGRDGMLPWRLPGDMAYFKRVTSEAAPGKANAVIMGRKTYESIPERFRPLPDRINVVLTRSVTNTEHAGEVLRCATLEAALEELDARADIDQRFVIGGGQVYEQALAHPRCDRVHVTRVHRSFACDTFLPHFEANFQLVRSDGPHQDGDASYTFELYERAVDARGSAREQDVDARGSAREQDVDARGSAREQRTGARESARAPRQGDDV